MKEAFMIENFKTFGNMLLEAKANLEKTLLDLARECGVSSTQPAFWQNGDQFPARERLPQIARAYRVDLNELTAAWEASKQARQEEKAARKRPRVGHRPESNFSEAIVSGLTRSLLAKRLRNTRRRY